MILLFNGGTNTHVSRTPSDLLLVGTVDGVSVLRRDGKRWAVADKGLRGCNISAVTATPSGTVFAASHGVGVARSRDGGTTWQLCNTGVARPPRSPRTAHRRQRHRRRGVER